MKRSGCFVILLMISGLNYGAWAWGGRGHATICEVAPFLIKNASLKEFMSFRPHIMGHLCNIPDVYWKGLTTPEAKAGSATHYINPEIIELAAKDVPLDFAVVNKTYSPKIKNLPGELGTLWWRTDQFMRRAAEQKQLLTDAKPPTGRDQEQDEKLPYNQGIYQWMVNIGLMGHFVGDASMPYHSSADHDGWKAEHGGIHSYYEDLVVAQFDGDLHQLVLKRARELMTKAKTLPYLRGTTVERMKAMSVISAAEVSKITQLDPILKKSVEEDVDGKKKKIPAERKPAKVALASFKNLIVDEMARSAVLLAVLWEDSYNQIGAPDLSQYRSYRYPLTPEFVPADYSNAGELKKVANNQ